MKIEICEQMVQSWLLNCELCEVVQTNWSISPLRNFTEAEIDEIKMLMEGIHDQLNVHLKNEMEIINALQESVDEEANEGYLIEANEEGNEVRYKKKTKVSKLNIFKKSTPAQFIKQCEIDVVGVKFNPNGVERIFLVDSAFHRAGLGYHDAVATVIKKIIRAVIVSVVIFGSNIPVNVIFAAPKCGAKLNSQIQGIVGILKKIVAGYYTNITIDLYFNETFTQEIYLPLKANLDVLNNDNDLFMRALNLEKVAEDYAALVSVTPSSKSAPTKSVYPKESKKASKRLNLSEDEKLAIVAFYLRNNETFANMDEIHFNIKNQHGVRSYNLLKRYGVTTEQKGLLITSNIDDEIAKASGILKETLIKIKNKGL